MGSRVRVPYTPHSYNTNQINGTLTEWLGSGLQNRVQQFESAGYLQTSDKKQCINQRCFFFVKRNAPNHMYYISKRIEIAFAHNLTLNYESKCQRIHGHNGIATIYCCSEELNENGMVVDFTQIKELITEKLDHRYLNEIFPFNPTAENLAYWIAQQVPHCYKVTFQESEGNIAAYVKPGFENAAI